MDYKTDRYTLQGPRSDLKVGRLNASEVECFEILQPIGKEMFYKTKFLTKMWVGCSLPSLRLSAVPALTTSIDFLGNNNKNEQKLKMSIFLAYS